MKIQGRPYFKYIDIEDKSKKLLLLFSQDYFLQMRPTPLLSIVDFLTSQYKIVFNFDTTLGFSSENSKVLGAFNPIKKVIFIDSSLKQDEHKFNFTLAHELGHLSLHRNIKIIREKSEGNEVTETVQEKYTDKYKLKTDLDWIEWQANCYASCLLMPKDIFVSKLINLQKQLGISKVGKIFVDSQICNQKTLFEIILLLSEYFKVSKTAVEYRLFQLKLVDDRRKLSFEDFLDIY